MAAIIFDKVSKAFNGTPVIEDLDLTVQDRELLVLVGPSGCGKSTLLRMLAGLEAIDGGEIRIDDRRINELPPDKRKLAMVFQNYALYPHMTVRDNLAFPLRMQRLSHAEIERRVTHTAKLLDLGPLLDRKPAQLSGGQRQRVAMGRAIVRDADGFLMDEPLSNLDARLRVQIRSEIAALQARLGTTMLYVTHDQVEAMTLGHRVAVLREGRLQQLADPASLYERPSNAFVAGFIGSPGMNLVRVALERTQDGPRVRLGATSLSLPPQTMQHHPDLQSHLGGELLLGIRPEALSLGSEAGAGQDSGEATLAAKVLSSESLGHETILHTRAELRSVISDANDPGDSLMTQPGLVAIIPGQAHFKPGERIHLMLDPQRLSWFGLDGEALTPARSPSRS